MSIEGLLFSDNFNFTSIIEYIEENILNTVEKDKRDVLKTVVQAIKNDNTFFKFKRLFDIDFISWM